MSIKKTDPEIIAKTSKYPMSTVGDGIPEYTDDYLGRGSLINPNNMFEDAKRSYEDDGWDSLAEKENRISTQLIKDDTKKIINYIKSPDIKYDRSINPYRGCEHGCIYCYARPTHEYLGFSPGLDFETKIVYKADAANLLRKELAAKNYKCEAISLGSNTDPYQQAEKKLKITRSILEVLLEAKHPVGIITKSALVLRDKDILEEMAKNKLAKVYFSITSLDPKLSAIMEPRAASPIRLMHSLSELSDAGIPCGVMVAPIIPFINDEYMEKVMDEAAAKGAKTIGYVFIRLPHQNKEIFATWLFHHFPDKAERVLNRIMDSRGGDKLYDSTFGKRMQGEGVFAGLIRQRFQSKLKRLNLPAMPPLRKDLFRPNLSFIDDGQMPLNIGNIGNIEA